jgi:hypothetical protein
MAAGGFPWENQGSAKSDNPRDAHYHQCTHQVAKVAGMRVTLEQLTGASERINASVRESFGQDHDTAQLAIDAQSYLAEINRLVGEAHALAALAEQNLNTVMRAI